MRVDPDTDQPVPSQSSVIFVFVFVVGSIYILGGFLYNRVWNSSSGLRGLEQLPNYRFWRSIFVFIQSAVAYVADGAVGLVYRILGRRRNAIRIDSAEHSFRNELFDSDEYDEEDALPIARR
ncbi:hypothetical protein GGI07_005707 [Coemansia sp. Benny D115]|nr:hypothetical protein GGI07_005707 [Coemansia sp. Benny D115]